MDLEHGNSRDTADDKYRDATYMRSNLSVCNSSLLRVDDVFESARARASSYNDAILLLINRLLNKPAERGEIGSR